MRGSPRCRVRNRSRTPNTPSIPPTLRTPRRACAHDPSRETARPRISLRDTRRGCFRYPRRNRGASGTKRNRQPLPPNRGRSDRHRAATGNKPHPHREDRTAILLRARPHRARATRARIIEPNRRYPQQSPHVSTHSSFRCRRDSDALRSLHRLVAASAQTFGAAPPKRTAASFACPIVVYRRLAPRHIQARSENLGVPSF